MCGVSRKEYDMRSFHGHIARARRLPQYPLASIAKNGVTQTLCRDEGDFAGFVRHTLVNAKYGHPHERVTVPSSAREDLLKLLLGLDGLHGDS